MNAPHPTRLSRDEARDLLARYPQVSRAEARLILDFIRNGRHLDVGMLTGEEALKPQLDSFTTDYRKELRLGIGEGSAAVGGIAAVLGLCWLLWEFVRPGFE